MWVETPLLVLYPLRVIEDCWLIVPVARCAMRDTNVITAPANSPPETGGSTPKGEGVDITLNSKP